MNKKFMQKKSGAIYLVLLLVMSGVFIFLATAIMSLAFANVRLARHNQSMVSSLSVAEAGVNYYLWHLSHSPLDYCDGHTKGSPECPTTAPPSGYGPYTHDFNGPDGTKLGTFILTITPPSLGGTIYDIKAVGTATNATVSRTVRAGVGIPSFASYAVLSNNDDFFETTETTDGPVHSNGGIRYDPPNANDIISSSVSTLYRPSWTLGGVRGADTSDCGGSCDMEPGVWSPHIGVDKSKWQFPVPPIDFTAVSANLTGAGGIRAKSLNGQGINLPEFANNSPNKDALGYYLKLKADGSIGMAAVTAENYTSDPTGGITIANNQGDPISLDQAANYAIPANFNGILYSEKPIWVEGTWNGKITIATASAANGKSITVINNLKYVTPRNDGTKKIGLIGTSDIRIPPYAPANLEIDAALLSNSGMIQYAWDGSKKDGTLVIYGSLASWGGRVFFWSSSDGYGSWVGGYSDSQQIYDQHLTIDPPPDFPTTGSYQVLTWREE